MDLARYIASRLLRWRRENSHSTEKQRFGAEGERIVARYLRRHGFRILYRNFRSPGGGEIDLVCRDQREACLVFVEVKSRQSTRFGDPSLAVRSPKQHLLIRGASAWLRLLGNSEVHCRFDIVELIGKGEFPEIRHIQNAFPVPANMTRI
ncbi:MAG: YraN family protein [Verrucomicrobia bacterium]|nr:MAG: YraN family protein [Verrucomicrobiota bacterium]